MRRTLILSTLIAGCASPAPSGDAPAERGLRYISIGADALGTARAIAAEHGETLDVREADGDVAVVAFDAARFGELSAQLHERFDRCGGFVLHDSIDDARASLHAFAHPAAGPAIDYTLDHAAAVRAVLAALDADNLLATIRALSAQPSRYFRSPTGAAASLWLQARWQSFTDRPDVTVELFDHGYAQKSVILTIPGGALANEVVVLGGHLDSISLRGGAADAPGADDDASGIATLTEVARGLLAHGYRPARTVKLIAYAAEEVGLRGSLDIVRTFQKRGVNVVGALQLDMTNYQGSEKDIWLMKDFTSAAQNNFLIQLIDTYVGATWGLDACGYACSDHAAWYRAGVPASMPFESRMAQRNMAIHTARDTLEISGNNAAHAIKFARLAAAFAIELGKGELGPAPAAGAPAASIAAVPDGVNPVGRWLALAFAAAAALSSAWLARRAARIRDC
jgi:bacterial leucyl aminopeptidase